MWYSYKPYVPVAERRAKAAKAAAKLAKKNGTPADPVVIEGRKIAATFWGKAWCDNLESYSDYENRLPRGRSYVRNGFVIDLRIESGRVGALVQGSSLYTVSIAIQPLPGPRWRKFVESSTGQVANLLDLLQGRLPRALLESITQKGEGLFPSPKEIQLSCSCPDGARMCKHVAAVIYGIGNRLDTRPELFFTLRGVDAQDLIGAAGETAATPMESGPAGLEGEDLSALFGVEIEAAPAEEKTKAKPKKTVSKKSASARFPAKKKKAKSAKKSRKPV